MAFPRAERGTAHGPESLYRTINVRGAGTRLRLRIPLVERKAGVLTSASWPSGGGGSAFTSGFELAYALAGLPSGANRSALSRNQKAAIPGSPGGCSSRSTASDSRDRRPAESDGSRVAQVGECFGQAKLEIVGRRVVAAASNDRSRAIASSSVLRASSRTLASPGDAAEGVEPSLHCAR